MFLTPNYELEGRWTMLTEENDSDDEINALYQDHATSEPFHSDFKTHHKVLREIQGSV